MTNSPTHPPQASKYGRRCAICGGWFGPQCFGGVWTNDWCDFMEGKITAKEVRESCAYCLSGYPPYMWGKEVHDAILAWRAKRLEDRTFGGQSWASHKKTSSGFVMK